MIERSPLITARKGQRITADAWNHNFGEVAKRWGVPNQSMPHPIPEGGETERAPAQIRIWELSGVAPDHVVCRDEEGIYHNVGKPPRLRLRRDKYPDLDEPRGMHHHHLGIDVLYFYREPYWRTVQTDMRVVRILQTDPIQEFVEVVVPDWFRQDDLEGAPRIMVVKAPDPFGLQAMDPYSPYAWNPVVWQDSNWENRRWVTAPPDLIPVPEPAT